MLRPEIKKIVCLQRDDITKLKVGAIVNAANNSLLGGGGVDGAIHKAAGGGLLKECKKLNGCKTGDAKITKGYNLPASHVIHTVGPIGENPEMLSSCYKTSLDLLKKNNLRSIAFPCISTGIYGYPNQQAAEVAMETVIDWLEVNYKAVDKVIFCLFMPIDVEIYKNLKRQYFGKESSVDADPHLRQRPKKMKKGKNENAEAKHPKDGDFPQKAPSKQNEQHMQKQSKKGELKEDALKTQKEAKNGTQKVTGFDEENKPGVDHVKNKNIDESQKIKAVGHAIEEMSQKDQEESSLGKQCQPNKDSTKDNPRKLDDEVQRMEEDSKNLSPDQTDDDSTTQTVKESPVRKEISGIKPDSQEPMDVEEKNEIKTETDEKKIGTQL